jgi:putative hydrolase of the HAD superfamily
MADGSWQMAGKKPRRMHAVVLDCLGTLLRLEPPGPLLRAELSARGIDVSESAAADAFRTEIAYYLEHHLEGSDRTSLDGLRHDCASVLASALRLGPERVAPVREAMLAALRFSPYPDVAPALAALRARGMRLVVASNWDCSLERVLTSAGLRPLVDGVVTSATVGAAKPDPAVVRAALDMAATDPADAVSVGDSLTTDVPAAREAGVEAILVDRGGSHAEAAVGLAVVRSLDEARSLILARG